MLSVTTAERYSSVGPNRSSELNPSPLKIRNLLNADNPTTAYPNLHPPPWIPTSPTSTVSDPSTLDSQASMAFSGTQALPPTNAPGRPQLPPVHLQSPPVHPQTSCSPKVQTDRPFPTPGPRSKTGSPWADTLRRFGMGESRFGVERPQAFMTLPGSETPIPVDIDVFQASKKAAEKRGRNAVASTRHRKKKKRMWEEGLKELRELRERTRIMEGTIEKLTQQRDFYRDRLRDIVKQTPSIRNLAAGPPSPTISTSNSCSETKVRDEPRGDSLPPYESPASAHPSVSPSGQPPMQMQGSQRLPPLRAMEGRPRTGPPPGPGLQEQDPRAGQWDPVQPRVPGTGWATRDTYRMPGYSGILCS